MKSRSLAALLLLLAAAARADEPPVGFYAGLGAGSATLELEDADSTADFKADDSAYKIILGYRFMKWLAVEGGYADYGQPQDDVLGVRLRGDFKAFTTAAVGLVPLGNFDLFGKLGFGAWDGSLQAIDFGGEVSEDNVDPLIGAGVQYRAGRFAMRVEIEGLGLGFDDDNDDEADGDDWIDFVSLGATWNF